MKVYDARGLQKKLGIGRDAAYKILREHGFLIGEKTRRISEEQIRRMICRKEFMTTHTE